MPEKNDTAGESLGVEKLIEEFRERFPYKIGYVPATTHSQIPEYTCTHDLSKEAKIIESFIRKAYLAGALAHEAACRVEKKEICTRCSSCDVEIDEKLSFNQALTEIESKSEEFLKGLMEGKM